MNIFKGLVFFLTLNFSFCVNLAAEDCDALLPGLIDWTKIESRDYTRLVIASKLARMSKAEADKAISGKGIIPIEGIPVGVGFSEGEFKSWQEQMKSEFNLDLIDMHSRDIYLSKANDSVIDGWLKCKEGYSRQLALVVKERDENYVLLTMRWFPIDRKKPKRTEIDFVSLKGASAGEANKYLRAGSVLEPYEEVAVPLVRDECQPLWVIIKVKDGEKVQEHYLPPPKPIPTYTLRIKVTGKSYYKGQVNRNATGWIDRGSLLELYNVQGQGPHGFDFNICRFDKDGYIMASSKDSGIPMSNDGSRAYKIGETSTSRHDNFSCECQIIEVYPALKDQCK